MRRIDNGIRYRGNKKTCVSQGSAGFFIYSDYFLLCSGLAGSALAAGFMVRLPLMMAPCSIVMVEAVMLPSTVVLAFKETLP